MAVVFAPALVTRVEYVGGDLMRHGDYALLLDELGWYIVGFLELGGGRNNALWELKSATFAQPRKAFEGPVEYACTFGLDPLFYRWVALALKGWELYDLDASKDARRGVRNPRCLVHRPDDLCGWRNFLGVPVLAVHDDRLARDQGVDDVCRAEVRTRLLSRYQERFARDTRQGERRRLDLAQAQDTVLVAQHRHQPLDNGGLARTRRTFEPERRLKRCIGR